MSVHEKGRRRTMMVAWLSVATGILLVATGCLVAIVFGSAFAVDLHTGARGPNLLATLPRFWVAILYCAAPFLVGAIALLFASARRPTGQLIRIARGVTLGAWVGLLMALYLAPWGLGVWLILMALYLWSGIDLGAVRMVQIGALLVGLVLLKVGYEYWQTAELMTQVERDAIKQYAALQEAGTLEKGRVGEYIEHIRRSDSESAQRDLLQQLGTKLARPVRNEWTDSDRKAIVRLAARSLQSDDEFVRSMSAKLKAATLFMDASPGHFSEAVDGCLDEHCRNRIAELFFDEQNQEYSSRAWTTADVMAAYLAILPGTGYLHKRSAARLLSSGVQPGAVCDALNACDAIRCESRAFMDGFVERLDLESHVEWKKEDTSCIDEAMNRSHNRYWVSKSKKEALDLWLARGDQPAAAVSSP